MWPPGWRSGRHRTGGRTADAEAREILNTVLRPNAKPNRHPDNLFDAIRAIVEPVGGVELDIPPREPGSRPIPTFD